ncbi:1409_t:CDS:2 [Dentiscutata heterogama]|uniref:1409_t:CDS:1 n=1 Tax=Dentiscutata heterogama TaxID=1316150 RepID=A0ACA9MB83_9GLOM|nr:1409_t:CDS:2 [Dentiscutata heterogama]
MRANVKSMTGGFLDCKQNARKATGICPGLEYLESNSELLTTIFP